MNSEGAEVSQARAGLVAPGAQLKAQREAMGWTVAQVADQLKLAPRQVVALEEGDTAALPNMAVVRGFIRAYAKVVKLDAAPLVAMVEVSPAVSASSMPVRREIPATFSQVRFSSLTQRSSMSKRWIVGALLVAGVAALGAYKLGLISPAMLMRADKVAGAPAMPNPASPASPGIAPLETTSVKPGQETAPLQSPSVPLISVPASASSAAAAVPAPAPSPLPASVAAPVAAPLNNPAPLANTAPAVMAATLPLAAAQSFDTLVLTARQASWVELRRVGATPLISRVIKSGSTETFKVTEPLLLIVGKPAGVDATLRGVRLDLPPGPGGKPSRVNIK